MLVSIPILALSLTGCSSDEGSLPNPATERDAGTGEDEVDSGATMPDASDDSASLVVTDLASHGYGEEEFFFEGEAAAFALQGEMTMDGKWTLAESTRAPFKSRLIVRRPTGDGAFNGTVAVEWLNVSGGADGDPGCMYNWQEILREGYAWVGVSAQALGTIPFTADKLMELYATHEDYVAKVAEAARAAREAGFILEPEERAMIDEADAAPIPD